MGAYTGDGYAGFNPMQDAAYGGMFDFGNPRCWSTDGYGVLDQYQTTIKPLGSYGNV